MKMALPKLQFVGWRLFKDCIVMCGIIISLTNFTLYAASLHTYEVIVMEAGFAATLKAL